MSDGLTLRCAGEQAIIAYLDGADPAAVSARVQALSAALPAALGSVLVDLVPSYGSVLVAYDGLRCDHYHAAQAIRAAARELGDAAAQQGRTVEIPAYYAAEAGEDLPALAAGAGLSTDEVVALHTGREYRVYAIGFAPGFAYLGEVDERIAAPRLSTPRQRVPRGAVAIADRQTAVYPAVSPGGWNLIGRSPMRMFDPTAEPPMPVAVGDRVRFVAISRGESLAAGGEL
jgi:KipI family sensor histidine kinase inhibitor